MPRAWVLVLLLAACNDEAPAACDGLCPDGGKDAAVQPPGLKITMCPAAPPPGPCTVTAGALPDGGAGAQLYVGNVLTPGEVLRGGQVAVDGNGVITCVACDCSAQAAAGATRVTCGSGVISPGLINPHDHLDYTADAPLADSGERYEQRNDWRLGLRGHTKLHYVIPAGTSAQINWGELRFILSGATSTVGSGAALGLLRNLDRMNAEEAGLNRAAVTYTIFPLGDSDGTQLTSGCAYPNIMRASSIANDPAFLPHVAEGVDAVARNEFLCASSSAGGGQDLTQKQSAFIHAAGLTAADYRLMATEGTSLIWSPRSNVRLYGDTADVVTAVRAGVRVGLGTDWTLSGSMNSLRELACADSLNHGYWGGALTDEQLWRMVTDWAAGACGVGDVLGKLAPGYAADLAIFDSSARADHRAVIGAGPADVLLVVRGGKPIYGDAALIGALTNDACDPLPVCGAQKAVCLMSEIGQTLPQVTVNSGGNLYPLFFCGTPMDEPSCVPTRPVSVNGSSVYSGLPTPSDRDGDGVPDATDSCPSVFNPIRPVDDGAQADFDHDGLGDPCDPDPFN